MKKYAIAAALAMFVSAQARVQEINNPGEFNDTIAKGASVVKFYTPECPNCMGARVPFERASNKFPNVHFIAVNTHDYNKLADKYGVKGLPTFAYFKDGKEIRAKKHVGNAAGLEKTIQLNVESLQK